ncbi:hypothetical protein HWV62_44824 [Athelia sp. TMB]|nr:hypothetical protein HWV62_44824 [Athelia sp. TMB]
MVLNKAELEQMNDRTSSGSEPALMPSCAKRYYREIKVWKDLHHENIAPLLGTTAEFGPHGSTGMVFPWMVNGTLNAFLAHNEPETAIRIQLVRGVASGITYLHSQGIIHGDLNGENIFVDDNMHAQIIGFGVSDEDMEFDGTSLAGGAMRWRAPELYKPLGDNLVDFTPVLSLACDVYSLGSLMLQILTGKIPYHDISPDICVLLALAHGMRPRFPPGFPEGFKNLIDHCWKEFPNDRPDIKAIGIELSALPAATLG